MTRHKSGKEPIESSKLGAFSRRCLKERERLPVGPGNIDLVVDNGYGGEVVVPPSGTAEVMPLRTGAESHVWRAFTTKIRATAYLSVALWQTWKCYTTLCSGAALNPTRRYLCTVPWLISPLESLCYHHLGTGLDDEGCFRPKSVSCMRLGSQTRPGGFAMADKAAQGLVGRVNGLSGACSC